MRSRRIPSLLTAAVACCGAADSAPSVRGGGGDRSRRRAVDDQARPQHQHQQEQHEQQQEQQQDQPNNDAANNPRQQQHQHHPQQRQRQRRSLDTDEHGSDYWWHENASDEKDVVYQDLGFSSNIADDKLQMLHEKYAEPPENALDEGEVASKPQSEMELNNGNGDDDDADGRGSNSFAVYSISVNNEPDTSDLPYRQPTRTPTPRPTRTPTERPTSETTRQPILQQSNGNGGSSSYGAAAAEGWAYYPLWTAAFSGCGYSDSPPEVYVSVLNGGEMQYLFDTKSACCESWFGDAYLGGGCLMEELSGGETSNGNIAVTSGGGGGDGDGGGSTTTSDDSSPSGGGSSNSTPNPPPSPPSFSSISNPAPNNNNNNNNPRPNPNAGGLWMPPRPDTPTYNNNNPSSPSVITTPNGNTIVSGNNNNSPPSPPSSSSAGNNNNGDFGIWMPPRPPPSPPSAAETAPNGNAIASGNDNGGPAPAPWDLDAMPTPPTEWPTFEPSAIPLKYDDNDNSPGNEEPAQEAPWELTPGPTSFLDETDNNGGEGSMPFVAAVTAVSSSTTALEAMLNGGDYDHGEATTEVHFEESFEEGYMHLTESEHEYFSWSRRGNGQWTVEENANDDGGYDDTRHAAAVTGGGDYALESTLKLTIGGDLEEETDGLRRMMEEGAYVAFGIKADVGFPVDSLIFRVDDKILGYWTQPTGGWERVGAYIPPLNEDEDGVRTVHELTWGYSYFGASEEEEDAMTHTAQLDGIIIEATTGDWSITEDDLYNIAVDGFPLPPALDLHHPYGDASWEIGRDSNAYDGERVFIADSLKMIRETNAIETYHAKAAMSVTIITGRWGGVLRFASHSHVLAPIDVLEIGLDGDRIMAVTNADDAWQTHSIDLTIPGKHIVTFTHISNPGYLDIRDLERMGGPGFSKVDGVEYVDNIDPALLTGEPTGSPTSQPSGAPTAFSIPVQNYCATTLDSIRDTCYKEDALTCNEGEAKCPLGTFCWGFVECELPQMMELSAMWWLNDDTPVPTSAPVLPPQNYCGTSLASIKETCDSGNVLTCNDDDGPCPTGTFCWGNVECYDTAASSSDEEDAVPGPTQDPTAMPTPLPAQNYCGLSTSHIRSECASGDPPKTCNDGDWECPLGSYCFVSAECELPEGTPVPTPAPVLQPQNYCGRQLAEIKETCASGNLPTCNDDDEPCAEGTYCWGNVDCDPMEETEEPTPSPVEEETIESFLSSFFSNNGGNDNQDSETSSQDEESSGCPEGTESPLGMPGCCVSDPSFLGDGACDAYAPYNTAECGYDLGDCCQDSCNSDSSFGCNAKEGDDYGPFGFFCLDPRYGSIDEEECNADNREWVGDGGCDPDYNNAACGWDGGDCCRDSCDSEFAYYECGRAAQPFDCKNPDIIYQWGYVP